MSLSLPPILLEPFIVRALIAAAVLAVTGGILGSFIQMRGMSFYTDTISHSAFTGVALGVLFGLDISLTAILFAIGVGILVLEIRKRTSLTFDTVLGVLFASIAALGLFILTFLKNVRVDLFGLLFGDILALSNTDVLVITVAAVIALSVIWSIRQQLILEIIHPDLAKVEGINTRRNDTIFGIVVATMIALGIKLIGIILLSGLFLIPSAASYLIAKSFRELIGGAIIGGLISALGGVIISAQLDTATGPTIVLTASLVFILSYFMRPSIKENG